MHVCVHVFNVIFQPNSVPTVEGLNANPARTWAKSDDLTAVFVREFIASVVSTDQISNQERGAAHRLGLRFKLFMVENMDQPIVILDGVAW